MRVLFPKGFLFGAATSSYQIEGARHEGGKGDSVWDTFAAQAGNIVDGSNGDIACDHVHRFKEDVALMKKLGLHAYRFSISWPRVMPDGRTVSGQGLAFYKDLVAELKKAGIAPCATLFHWDLPQALQEEGGFASRACVDAFVAYAKVMFDALGDDVAMWITHNEPWVYAYLGHYEGIHAPGIRSLQTAADVMHHLLLSHGEAVKAYRETGYTGKIGITLNLNPSYAASDKPEDKAASDLYDAYLCRQTLEPVFRASYPERLVQAYREAGISFPVKEDDMAIIAQPLDFLGINHYFPSTFVASEHKPLAFEEVFVGRPRTASNWEVYPEGFFDVLTRVTRDYAPPAIYVTENGAAFDDTLEGDDVHDEDRLAYYQGYLAQAVRAIKAGVPLKGYFAWSLMDNFEWAWGYALRFGIVYVDYPTQRRILKDSAKWYAGVIRNNGF